MFAAGLLVSSRTPQAKPASVNQAWPRGSRHPPTSGDAHGIGFDSYPAIVVVRPCRIGWTVAWFSAVVGGVVLVAWLLVLWLTGSPAGDVLRWVGAVFVGVLAPGFVVVRVSRRAVAPLIEDASWAAAAGSLVALVGWFLDRTLPLAPGPLDRRTSSSSYWGWRFPRGVDGC